MKVRTKFNVGDKIVGISKVWVIDVCPDCKGVGEIKFNNCSYVCKSCSGSGKRESYTKRSWEVGEYQTISCVVASEKEKGIEIYYNDVNDRFIAREQDCFLTKEEAQKECDKRNGKIR